MVIEERSEVQDEPEESSLNHGLRRKFLMGGLSTLEPLDETNMGLKWEEKDMVPIGEVINNMVSAINMAMRN